MAMPGVQGGQMGMQGQLSQQQQQMMHQQMVAQGQGPFQQAQQQQLQMNQPGMSPMMGGGPSPHPQQMPMGMMQGHPGQGQPHPGQMGPGPQGQGQPHPGHPGQQQQQHQGQHPGMMQEQTRMDNISKAKSLVTPIKDTLSNVLRTAANAIYANNMVDSGSKPVDYDVSRFDRSLEEFFTLCDQMEVHLKTSMECINQGMSSQRYLQTPVSLTKIDGTLTYPQYINVVRGQISYAKEVHGTLAEAAQKLSE